MKTGYRVLAMLLAVLMVSSCMTFIASADFDPEENIRIYAEFRGYDQYDDEYYTRDELGIIPESYSFVAWESISATAPMYYYFDENSRAEFGYWNEAYITLNGSEHTQDITTSDNNRTFRRTEYSPWQSTTNPNTDGTRFLRTARYYMQYRVKFYGEASSSGPDPWDIRSIEPSKSGEVLFDEFVYDDEEFTIPYFSGQAPFGKVFGYWVDQDGYFYEPGEKIYLDEPMVFYPYFVSDTDNLVIFKDPDTGVVYDVKIIDDVTQQIVAPDAPYKEGYTFKFWYADGTNVYYPGDLITSPTPREQYYYAFWEANEYDIYSYTHGTAYVSAPAYAKYGDWVSFHVGTSDPNETVTEVIVKSVSNVIPVFGYSDGSYEFMMPADDVEIEVKVAKDVYKVTFVDDNNRLIKSLSVNKGATLDEEKFPDAPEKKGYSFDKWVIVGNSDNGKEFTPDFAVYSDLVVMPVYEGRVYNISLAADSSEFVKYLYVSTATQDKDLMDDIVWSVEAKTGEVVSIRVAAQYNYTIAGVAVRNFWTEKYVVAPTLIKTDTDAYGNIYYEYGFEMPAEDLEIAVYTAANTYKVIADENVDAWGEYRINGYDTTNLPIPQGDDVEVKITPKNGYYVANVTAEYTEGYNNLAVPGSTLVENADGTYSFCFKMVGADVYLHIEYAAIDYNVDVQMSNSLSTNYIWDSDTASYIFKESLDPDECTKGYVAIWDDPNYQYLYEQYDVDMFRHYYRPANATYNVGDTVYFDVVEYTGYDIRRIDVLYAGGTKSCYVTEYDEDLHCYSFTMPDEDVFILVEYEPETYKVIKDASDEAHGKVTVNGLMEYEVAEQYKDVPQVVVTPDDGWYVESISYKLVEDTNNDYVSAADLADFSGGASYTGTALTDTLDTDHLFEFYMPACDVEIDVTYAKIDYTITTVVIEEGTGTITVDSPKQIGDEVYVKVTPEYGYVLDKLTFTDKDGNRISYFADQINQTYGAEYYFTMPASPVTVTATFVKDSYTVFYFDSDNSIIRTEAIKYKETATLIPDVYETITTPHGYHFVGWRSNDVETPVTDYSLDRDDFVVVKTTSIIAVYEPDLTAIFFNKTTNGNVIDEYYTGETKDGMFYTLRYYSDDVDFVVTPDEGYVIDDIKIYAFDEFYDQESELEYYLDFVDGNDYYFYFYVPATYKEFSNDNFSYCYVDVYVTFKKDTFDLTKTSISDGGTVYVNGEVVTDDTYSYLFLDMVNITAVPDPGYYVASIEAVMTDDTVTNTEDSALGYSYTYYGTKPAVDVDGTTESVTFPMPATDMTYSVVFEKCDYSITADIVSGTETGTVTFDSPKQVGDKVTVTATPAYGYILESIVMIDKDGNFTSYTDKTDTAYGAEYNFIMPASPVTVQVNFVKDSYTVTYYDYNSDVLLTETINYKETATLTAEVLSTPNGQHFTGWVSDDTETAVTTPSLNTADFVIVRDTVIKAVYEIDTATVIFDMTENGETQNSRISGSTKDADQSAVYAYNEEVEFTAVPDEGYAISDVYATTSDINNNQTVSLTVFDKGSGNFSIVVPANYKTSVDSTLSDDIHVTVIFTKVDYYASAAEIDPEGTVSLNGLTVAEGVYGYDYLDIVNITVTPEKGYYVESIEAVPADASASSTEDTALGYTYTYTGEKPETDTDGAPVTISFPMPASNIDYSIRFAKCDYSISFEYANGYPEATGGSAVTDHENDIAQPGDLVIVSVIPDEGFKCTDITIFTLSDMQAIPANFLGETEAYAQIYTFTMPADPVEIGVFFEQVASRQFVDVKNDSWYYNAVYFNVDRGYFRGYNDEMFGPSDLILRRDFAVVLARVADADLTPYVGAGTSFSDVPADSYYEAAIAWGVDNGIFVGYDDGSFGTDDNITREQIVAMLCKFAAYMGIDTELSGRQYGWMQRYTDLDDISGWAFEAMAWAVDNGIVDGYTASTLAPQANATRAQAAQMIMNFCDHVLYR